MEGERFLKAHPTDSAFTYLPLKHALSIEDWDSLEKLFWLRLRAQGEPCCPD